MVAEDIMFQLKSNLNGDNPQFTLTCISTGGPATTVTWTRDSETVSGGMTVFNNAVTAQYTNTLTVTGRLGGQYQCSVTNNKPSISIADLRVHGIAQVYYVMTVVCSQKRFAKVKLNSVQGPLLFIGKYICGQECSRLF